MANLDDDQNVNPMIYDAMRELENRIRGEYVAWQDQAKTPEEAEYWQREILRLSKEVRAVDINSQSAIDAKRAELRELFASLPDQAPEVGL